MTVLCRPWRRIYRSATGHFTLYELDWLRWRTSFTLLGYAGQAECYIELVVVCCVALFDCTTYIYIIRRTDGKKEDVL